MNMSKGIINIKIFDAEWNVYSVDIVNEDIDLLGQTDYENQVIKIKRGIKSVMLKTLKHELTHLWLDTYGHNAGDKRFTKEDVCEIVSSINDFINKYTEEWNKNIEKYLN